MFQTHIGNNKIMNGNKKVKNELEDAIEDFNEFKIVDRLHKLKHDVRKRSNG